MDPFIQSGARVMEGVGTFLVSSRLAVHSFPFPALSPRSLPSPFPRSIPQYLNPQFKINLGIYSELRQDADGR